MGRDRTPYGMALSVLRALSGWDQRTLASALALTSDTISEYERGKRIPKLETLHRAALAMGFDEPLLDRALSLAEEAAELGAAEEEPHADDRLRHGLRTLVTDASARFLGRAITRGIEAREAVEAVGLWRRLASYRHAQRVALVREGERFWRPALAKLLCAESEREAAASPAGARELAELAILIAERVSASASGPVSASGAAGAGLLGYCRAHLANALRVAGHLGPAEAELARAIRLREAAGGAGLHEAPLEAAQLLSLESSLRYQQGRLSEALALIARALAIEPGPLKAHLLIKQARVLEEAGDFGGAIETYRATLPLLGAETDARLLWMLKFNLLELLVRAGRHDDAEPLIADVGELAPRHATGLDRIRLRWIAGRFQAGRGRVAEAVSMLRGVRAEFAAAEIPYDTALVTLELAALLAEQGETAEVKTLARHLAAVFHAEGLERQASAALGLFRRAAERDAATAEMARAAAEALRRARQLAAVMGTNLDARAERPGAG
jgi:transcriptional regulator with XRE-family HTH domain